MLNSMSERKLYYYATQINLPQATQNITGHCGLSLLYQMFRNITAKYCTSATGAVGVISLCLCPMTISALYYVHEIYNGIYVSLYVHKNFVK